MQCLQGALGGLEIPGFAQQVTEPQQAQRRHAIARRHRVVIRGDRSVDQLLMVVRGQVESATLLVLEVREHGVGQRLCQLEVSRAPARLQELKQTIQQKNVIVEVGVEMRTAVLGHGQEASVAPKLGAQKIECPLGGAHELAARKQTPASRHASDHQTVPRRQYLFVASRPHALLAYL